MSERDIIAEMADVLARSGVDLGDERRVIAALYWAKFYEPDINQYLHAAIDRARALLAHAEELVTS